MTQDPLKQKEPEPKPGVEVDDHLYVHHEGQPCTGRVLAHGRHGVTVDISGKPQKVKWDKVLGHKKRAMIKGEIVDQGEDGMIVKDHRGQHRFIGVPNESKEDPMVAKSFQRPVALFMKAVPGPGLAEKRITDKNGVQTTRWVSTDLKSPPAQRGQHVGFQNGEHRGHGQVAASGRHGVTVRDAAGGEHRVHHEKVTHHWGGEGEPDHSPHDPVHGPRIDANWNSFSKQSGTLGIPRNKMPQVDEADIGELTQFLADQGIKNEQTNVDPHDLKPTQAEFSPDKVKNARTRGGDQRPVLVSSDNYVLDRHHQWLAGREDGKETVPAIRFDAPIQKLLAVAAKFPKARGAAGSGGGPDAEARLEGENDKQYAKRVVDKWDAPESLPEKHDDYFNTKDSTHVPLDKLHSTKTDEENQQGGDNGPKRMLAASQGKLGKRDPIAVMPHADKEGHFEVVDGNGTLTSAKKLGWKGLPTKVVSRDEGLSMQATDKAKDFFKKANVAALPKRVVQPHSTWEDLSKHGPEGLAQFKKALGGVAKELGLQDAGKSPEDMTPEEWANDKDYLFIAPLKSAARAKEKAEADYDGDYSQLCDMVRGTIAVSSMDKVQGVLDKFFGSGLEIAQQPKNRFASPTSSGYRDLLMVVKLPNGMMAELQVNVKSMMQAKSGDGHAEYEAQRSLQAKNGSDEPDETWSDADHQEYYRAVKAQKAIYGQAWNTALGAAKQKSDKSTAGGDDKLLIKSDHPAIVVLWKT